MKKEKKTSDLHVRLRPTSKFKLKRLASIYAGGNVSKMVEKLIRGKKYGERKGKQES